MLVYEWCCFHILVHVCCTCKKVLTAWATQKVYKKKDTYIQKCTSTVVGFYQEIVGLINKIKIKN